MLDKTVNNWIHLLEINLFSYVFYCIVGFSFKREFYKAR